MGKFHLDGSMIPRSVRRMFDQRTEERIAVDGKNAVLGFRGRDHIVALLNISRSGAMVGFDKIPNIGERVTLQMLDQAVIRGQVRWIRDGRVGIGFD